MLPFLQQPAVPKLPSGYRLDTTTTPSPAAINRLLESCQETTHDEQRWPLALERSLWQISIFEEARDELVGFVRATSDLALNANLWNLAARPGPDQAEIYAVVHRGWSLDTIPAAD